MDCQWCHREIPFGKTSRRRGLYSFCGGILPEKTPQISIYSLWGVFPGLMPPQKLWRSLGVFPRGLDLWHHWWSIVYVLQIKPSKIEKTDSDDYLSPGGSWSLGLLNQQKIQPDLEKSKQNICLGKDNNYRTSRAFEYKIAMSIFENVM